jgi:uncharacterized protein
MLLTFKISNYLSFDEEVSFIMQASSVRELGHHVIKGKGRNDVDILKSAVIYGANAAGKSNFVKAIQFAKNIIVKGLLNSNVFTEGKYFRLDTTATNRPTQFEFEFKHNGKMYAYGVVLLLKDKKIKEEWLFELLKTTDKPIFERTVLDNGKSSIQLHLSLDKEGRNRFAVYEKDLKDTQLFLSEINDKNIDDIKNIQSLTDAFDWFKNQIVIIYPHTRLEGLNFVGNNEEMKQAFGHFLKTFKTGVQAVETIAQEIDPKLPTKIHNTILNDFAEKDVKGITIQISGKTFNFSKNQDGEIKMYKLNTKRAMKNSAEMIDFEIEEESDGTRRIMDFVPALVGLAKTEKTYVIDEIDRSLHPELTQKILETFFSNTSGIESQLIVTTHESSLLDLSLLRRDEIWFVEKDNNGASQIYSLEQFKPRHDSEVRKAYLQGRFGAIPFVSNVNDLGWLNTLSNN